MNTTYYWRLTARNRRGVTVLAEGLGMTAPAQPPAAQVSVQTGPARTGENGSATVEGTLTAGGTPASVEVQVFYEPGHPYDPSQTFSLGQYPADAQAVSVSGVLTGLECGHSYEWLLAAHTPYGESLGERKPLLIPCN